MQRSDGIRSHGIASHENIMQRAVRQSRMRRDSLDDLQPGFAMETHIANDHANRRRRLQCVYGRGERMGADRWHLCQAEQHDQLLHNLANIVNDQD